MAAKTEIVQIRPIEEVVVPVRIVGKTPLIVHAWSEKAKRMMLDAQQGKKKGKQQDFKNPVEDFIESLYWLSEKPTEYTEESFNDAVKNGAKFGFPVTGIKQAAISAAYRMGWAKDKVSLRGAFFIDGDENGMVEIQGSVPEIREDMVRIGMGTADIRYRGEFRKWHIDLNIRYNANGQFSLENILNILNAGGYACGIGEWRPEKDGQNGMFSVETN